MDGLCLSLRFGASDCDLLALAFAWDLLSVGGEEFLEESFLLPDGGEESKLEGWLVESFLALHIVHLFEL